MSDLDFRPYTERVARMLCGEPNNRLSKPDELRFGSNGSLKVVIAGNAAGTFADHETKETGGLLDLIALKRGGDRKEAMAWLAETFGIEGSKSERIAGRNVVATYAYHDAEGRKQFEVLRLEKDGKKEFRQRKSETEWTVKGCPILPYKLPELTEAIASERLVFVVEGEKDVERLARVGRVATCNAGGAGKWKAEHAAWLKDADVVILPDNDEAGQDHGQSVARSLRGIANRVRVLDLPDLPRKGDVSDWIAAGNTVEALDALVEAAVDWRPASSLGLTWFGDEDHHPPRKWLAKGLLGQHEFSVVFAPSGGGKSFVALDLGCRIAAGMDWFDHRVERSAVLYVAGEGATGFRQRMKAWRLHHDSEGIPFVMLPRSIDLYSQKSDAIEIVRAAMAEIAERAGVPVRMIVLDTLSRMMHGGVDSDPKDMKIFLEAVEDLRRESGAHVMIVHHTGKELDRGMRGSSMLRDFADTVLKIEAPFEDGPHKIVVDKQKDGEEGRNYRFRLSQSTIGTDEEGEDITSCVIDPLGASETTGPEKASRKLSDRNEIARRILADLLAEAPVTPVTSGIPTSVTRTVTMDAWRNACSSRFAMESDGAFRTAFSRIKENLMRLNVIGTFEGRVWLALQS